MKRIKNPPPLDGAWVKYHVRCNPRYAVKEPCATCGHGRRRHRGWAGYCRHVDRRGIGCSCNRFVPFPEPATLICPSCKKIHVDEGEFATRPHRTHRCVDDVAGRGCGAEWEVVGAPRRGVLPRLDAPEYFFVTDDRRDAPDGARIFLEPYNAEYERRGGRWERVR